MEEQKKKVSKAQQAATHRYIKKNYDRLELMVKKGGKDTIKKAANAAGESVNEFVTNAVENRLSEYDLSIKNTAPDSGGNDTE